MMSLLSRRIPNALYNHSYSRSVSNARRVRHGNRIDLQI
jgi:ribosomal protein S4